MISEVTKIELDSLEDTGRIGRSIGEQCRAGDIICLDGDLGAGKTTLAQAIARGAGVAAREYVCSPTFGLMHEYEGKLPIYHMDFYRLDSVQEIIEVGLEDYFYGQGLTIIEWYKKGEDILPEEFLEIQLVMVGHTSRRITLASKATSWHARLNAMLRNR